jgi:hypothetical protein
MRWQRIAGVTLIVSIIFLYEWPRIKRNPPKDKAAFAVMMLAGWVLSLFDLPVTTGPITWITTMFKPLGKMMEK